MPGILTTELDVADAFRADDDEDENVPDVIEVIEVIEVTVAFPEGNNEVAVVSGMLTDVEIETLEEVLVCVVFQLLDVLVDSGGTTTLL